MNRREWLKRITWLTLMIGMVGIVVGSFFYSDPNSPNWNPNDYTTYEIWAVAVAPLCVCCLAWIIVATNWWWHQAVIATTPVPTSAQICAQFQAEYGRPPTLDEVAATQQMLGNQRNEALVNAGIGLGALYVIHRKT